MTPGYCPMGVTSLVLDSGQAKREAKVCARGSGNLIFVIDPSYL